MILTLLGTFANGQCANNNTLLAGGTITPSCPGTTRITCINGGEYALVNVTNGNIYTFSTCGAPFDTQITLYNNAGGGNLGYNDDSGYCGGTQSYISWTANYTGQLRVLVDQYNCTTNSICTSLAITCATAPAAMTNNECAGAITLLPLDGCFMQTYTSASSTRSTTSPNPTCGGPFNNTNFRDVWFRFIAPANGIVVIETVPGTLTDGVMQLVHGTCASYTNIECDDDDGIGYMPLIDRRCAALIPGDQYMIRVWGLSGARGSFGICVRGMSNFTIPQEDCQGGATICGDQQLNNATNYTGCVSDLSAANRGCLWGNERQGTWYYFSPSAGGDLGLTIQPTGNVDYDFAIWGPLASVSCPPAAPPTRCSWAYPPAVPGYPAAIAFQTGMRASAPENSEPDSGPGVDGFVSTMTVVAGEVYIMFIDNFDITGQAFALNWTLTNGASLDCTLLPVEMANIEAIPQGDRVTVAWSTISEQQSDHFVVEHSMDALSFRAIGVLPAAGSSATRREYSFADHDAVKGLNYYRLKQVDQDGGSTFSEVVSARLEPKAGELRVLPNPATTELRVDLSASGAEAVQIAIYDATGRTVFQEDRNSGNSYATMTIQTQFLAAGSYHLRVSEPNGQLVGTARFLKQ